MLWHALLLVARLQRVKNGAGLQDDRKLPPPQNVALHLTTERCSKNGGDADECVAALQADNAKFLCGGATRTPQCKRRCHGWAHPTNNCLSCDCVRCSHCTALGLRGASPCALRCLERYVGSTKSVRQQRVNHSVVSQRALTTRRRHTAMKGKQVRHERRTERMLNSYSRTSDGEKVVKNKLRAALRMNITGAACPVGVGAHDVRSLHHPPPFRKMT